MSTLVNRIEAVSDLSQSEAEHLRLLCSSWQVLADLSFSDLLLYVPTRGEEEFTIVAQLRPFTSQTLHPEDLVGARVRQPEQPFVERAFREGRIWAQTDPVLVDGVPINMDAVPVRSGGRVVSVLTKEGSPLTTRRPGMLEGAYLEAAAIVSEMVAEGVFPFYDLPPGEWPRVGDGLFVFDLTGAVSWASPNALSSLRRMGVRENVVGRSLDELGHSPTPVLRAMRSQRLLDGELSRGDNHVMLRVLPLIRDGVAVGALGLARDVSELRQKDRLISVKDATIREIHHRVKNNLQTIASLLRLQGRRLATEEARGAIRESVIRIGAIALVHETLSEGPTDVGEFAEVVRRIVKMVREGLVSPEQVVELDVQGSVGPLAADLATPLAVVVSELIQNALEHAFPERPEGRVSIGLSRSDDAIAIKVRDDGVGIDLDGSEGTRLGLHIVRSLVGELNGTFDISKERGGGTCASVEIPLTTALVSP